MSTSLLADSQGKYFDQFLEECHILTLFHSGNKVEDLFPKYSDVIPSFDQIIIQIGSNNSLDPETTILNKMQQLYEEICSVNPKAEVNFDDLFFFSFFLFCLLPLMLLNVDVMLHNPLFSSLCRLPSVEFHLEVSTIINPGYLQLNRPMVFSASMMWHLQSTASSRF